MAEVQYTLDTPQQISCLAFTHSKQLITASVDGSVRLYAAGSSKVSKAIRGLNGEVASVAHVNKKGAVEGELWVAVEHQALLFSLDNTAMILTQEDAVHTIPLGDHAEDALNSITLNHNASKLAWTSDEGVVGVLDLLTLKSTRMRVKHSNIGGCVGFIPDRPSEIVSGGYDCALLHFDSTPGSLHSRFDIPAAPPESGVSLSPPFVLSAALSSAGVIAAGTADGRVILGSAGEKLPSKKGKGAKRSRKWEGLKEDGIKTAKIAEGPVVAMAFIGTDMLLSCTLLGTLKLHHLSRASTDGDGSVELVESWSREMHGIAKANGIAVTLVEDGRMRIAVGGVSKNGKGIVLICEM
ncbi:WD40 repeat-like protein [Athelia psychrophila]|uniref:WD40 repeat-like protein n=1 Tax=Athelia psychrophila TaxID=1759441 RepID=A0A166BEI1_9AGAM|nr:WD40 repeat-like protein [Fibularhizoctonia sp. CBS 109695]